MWGDPSPSGVVLLTSPLDVVRALVTAVGAHAALLSMTCSGMSQSLGVYIGPCGALAPEPV